MLAATRTAPVTEGQPYPSLLGRTDSSLSGILVDHGQSDLMLLSVVFVLSSTITRTHGIMDSITIQLDQKSE